MSSHIGEGRADGADSGGNAIEDSLGKTLLPRVLAPGLVECGLKLGIS